MSNENQTLREVYLKPEQDEQLRQASRLKSMGRDDLLRSWIETGIKQAFEDGPDSPALRSLPKTLNKTGLICRPVYVNIKSDGRATQLAHELQVSHTSLLSHLAEQALAQALSA